MDHWVGAIFFGVVLVALSALGFFFLFHKRARGTLRTFGLVLVATALPWLYLTFVSLNVGWDGADLSRLSFVMGAGNLLAGAGLAAFVVLYVGRPSGRMWWAVASALMGGIVLVSPYVWLIVEGGENMDLLKLLLIGSFAFSGFLVGATMLILAFVYPHQGGTMLPAGEQGFLSAGTYLFGSAFLIVQGVVQGVLLQDWRFPGALFVYLVALTGVWVYKASLSPPACRVARNIALLVPAVPLVTLVSFLLGSSGNYEQGSAGEGLMFGLIGLLMLFGLLVVAYSVLRQQFLGVTLRVRWGVSKGFFAGFFIATLFIVGEAAESFFGDLLGTYLGILAAGLLIFAFAPLQRFADRLSRYTVPAAFTGTSEKTREEIYRHALRGALKDRVVTQKEEIRLAELAEELGIGAGRAAVLLSEAKRVVLNEPGAQAGGA